MLEPPGLNRTSVGLKPRTALVVARSATTGLNRTSVGLKRPPERLGPPTPRRGLNRTSVGLKLRHHPNRTQVAQVASIEPAWD